MPRPSSFRMIAGYAVTLIAALALVVGVVQLLQDEVHVERERVAIGDTPATVFRPSEGAAGPVVLLSHGFAGSRPLMDPVAMTLSGNGYTVVSFDYLGHGRNPNPLYGDITSQQGAAQALVDQTRRVADFALGLDESDGRLVLVGHSMATNIIVRYAQANDSVIATAGISLFAPTVDESTPGNLLSVVGGFERRLEEEGRRMVALSTGLEPDEVELNRTYGDFSEGNARRIAVAPGVEHVGVLYSTVTLQEVLDWTDAAYDRESEGWLAQRGAWIALVLAATILLGRPVGRALPRAGPVGGTGSGAGWRRIAVVAGVPAVLTPLLLAPVPTDFLPVAVGDYVAIHFGVYGLLMAGLLWMTREEAAGGQPTLPRASGSDPLRMRLVGFVVGVATLLGYYTVLQGVVLDQWVTNFRPVSERIPLILVMMVGTVLYFLADEWLTRGRTAPKGAYPATKVLFLLSLGGAVALDVDSLFFLIMIVPIIVIFFLVYGFVSRWSYHGTGHPLVAGIANGVGLAWALGVTFPMLGGG